MKLLVAVLCVTFACTKSEGSAADSPKAVVTTADPKPAVKTSNPKPAVAITRAECLTLLAEQIMRKNAYSGPVLDVIIKERLLGKDVAPAEFTKLLSHDMKFTPPKVEIGDFSDEADICSLDAGWNIVLTKEGRVLAEDRASSGTLTASLLVSRSEPRSVAAFGMSWQGDATLETVRLPNGKAAMMRTTSRKTSSELELVAFDPRGLYADVAFAQSLCSEVKGRLSEDGERLNLSIKGNNTSCAWDGGTSYDCPEEVSAGMLGCEHDHDHDHDE